MDSKGGLDGVVAAILGLDADVFSDRHVAPQSDIARGRRSKGIGWSASTIGAVVLLGLSPLVQDAVRPLEQATKRTAASPRQELAEVLIASTADNRAALPLVHNFERIVVQNRRLEADGQRSAARRESAGAGRTKKPSPSALVGQHRSPQRFYTWRRPGDIDVASSGSYAAKQSLGSASAGNTESRSGGTGQNVEWSLQSERLEAIDAIRLLRQR